MAWKIERQANGKFAIWSSRASDYIVIDATAEDIEREYARKGVEVYVASARAQMAKDVVVSDEGEAKIAASRERGVPVEPEEPIGATGFRRN